MSGVFEVIASSDEQATESAKRAVIAAQTRAKARFEKFVSKAKSEVDHEARLALIDSNLRDLAREAADEYDGDPEQTYLAATAVLGGGHPAGCDCGFCKNKGKLPGSDSEPDDDEDDTKESSFRKHACEFCGCNSEECNCSEDSPCGHEGCKFAKKESSVKASRWSVISTDKWIQKAIKRPGQLHKDLGVPEGEKIPEDKLDEALHSDDPKERQRAQFAENMKGVGKGKKSSEVTAADVETGDKYQSERVDLPAADKSGLGSEGSPKIDKGKSGDETGWNLEPIDVGSQRHRLENQQADDRAEYNDSDFDPSNPVRNRVDADTAMQPEFSKGDATKTWTGTEGLADPVTSKFRNWTVIEG